MMDIKNLAKRALVFGVLYTLSQGAAAQFLTPVLNFVRDLIEIFSTFGYSLAVVMFLYGAAKYVYTADDPGGRKQALGILIAAIMAILIIQAAEVIICTVPLTNPDGSANTVGC